MTKPVEDKAFVETHMVHGRASRRPLRRRIGALLLGLCLVGTAMAIGSRRMGGGDADKTVFTLPGGLPVTENQLTALYFGVVGVVILVVALRRYRRDRALARRGRG